MKIDQLTRHMDPALWVDELDAKTKDDALQELTRALVASGKVKDQGVILEMLRNRESLGSTAVGSGVAFPHGRSVAIPELCILVARSRSGVDFDSMDGEPTHLFFLLLAPPQDTGNIYLQALGAITGLVQKDTAREKLLAAKDYESLVAILEEAGE